MATIQSDQNQGNAVDLLPPEISHLNRDTFQHNGKKYLSIPTITEFLIEAGIGNIRIFRQIMRDLQIQGISTLEDMINLNKSQLMQLDSVNADIARKVTQHLVRVKHKGSLLLGGNELEKLEEDYYYLEFEKNIDRVLFKHTNGKQGIRSKSVIELCGDVGVGKTQWCMIATCSMLQVGKKVAYIDSENGFDYSRIKQIAKQNELSQRSIRDNIIFTQIDSFDDLDVVLDQLSPIVQEQNIGMIVIDSIMQILQNTYPVDSNLDNLAQRQLHLRKTMRRLRLMARYHNLIIIYTNHNREARYIIPQDFNEDLIEGDDLKTVINLLKRLMVNQIPMGGQTLAHSSDMRIYLTKKKDNENKLLHKASMENCSFLPKVSVEFIITSSGLGTSGISEKRIRSINQAEASKDHIRKLNDLLG
ncbi:MAG: hypothetical protein GPJ54_06240 [Candidatus Heimdallarchaeota archaeon]|nr:hypothetical protein [Candidatus Heimdallarchaeota archaeon]